MIAVSPFVAGRAVKGPTEQFMRGDRPARTAAGVASLYEGLIDAMVVDAGDPDPAPDEVRVALLPDPDGGRRRAGASWPSGCSSSRGSLA